MLAAYNIFKQDPDQVTLHFEQFNRDFYEMCSSFKEVTHFVFKAGQNVEVLKPVGSVRPVKRQSTLELGLSNDEAVRVEQFLETHGLQELLQIFLRKGVAVEDILEMTLDEMEMLGIKAFSLRKRLLRVIESQAQHVLQPQIHRQVYQQVRVCRSVLSTQNNLCRVLLVPIQHSKYRFSNSIFLLKQSKTGYCC